MKTKKNNNNYNRKRNDDCTRIRLDIDKTKLTRVINTIRLPSDTNNLLSVLYASPTVHYTEGCKANGCRQRSRAKAENALSHFNDQPVANTNLPLLKYKPPFFFSPPDKQPYYSNRSSPEAFSIIIAMKYCSIDFYDKHEAACYYQFFFFFQFVILRRRPWTSIDISVCAPVFFTCVRFGVVYFAIAFGILRAQNLRSFFFFFFTTLPKL